MSDYASHRCDFCTGTVHPIVARNEPVQLRDGVVLLDGVVIGKYDHCDHRYYPAEVVKRAERAVAHPAEASRTEIVPVIAA